MLISELVVPVKTSQPTSIDVYDSREIENIYYEGSYTISYRRSPFNVETNAFNALWALGALGLSMLTKPSSGKHRLEATTVWAWRGSRGGQVQLRNLTTLVLGRHNPKFNKL